MSTKKEPMTTFHIPQCAKLTTTGLCVVLCKTTLEGSDLVWLQIEAPQNLENYIHILP